MFSKIDWYFSKRYISASALVGIIFYSLFFLIGLLENADSQLPINDYLIGVGLETFSFFYDFLPTILLLAFLLAFGSMASKREIVVLQALGYPFKDLVTTVLKGTFLVLLIWGLLAEYLFPLSINQAKKILSQTNQSENISINGEWIRSNNSFIKIISTKENNLFGITIYQLDKHGRLSHFYTAEKGFWQDNTLSLTQVKHIQYTYTNEPLPQGLQHTQLTKQTLANKSLLIDLTFDTFSYVSLEPNQMHLSQLLRYADYIKENNIDGGGSGKFIFAFWERVFMPLGIIGLILITMPSMLGTPRVQRLGDKVFIGIMMGIFYFIITEFARNSNAYMNISNEFAAILLPSLLLGAGIITCYRAN